MATHMPNPKSLTEKQKTPIIKSQDFCLFPPNQLPIILLDLTVEFDITLIHHYTINNYQILLQLLYLNVIIDCKINCFYS